MEYSHIKYSVDDRVATLAIDRPKVLNAWTQQTLDELMDAFRQAEADKSVGVIVLTGTGERAFCVGGDVNWEKAGGLATVHNELPQLILGSRKPVIARVNGYAIGGGHWLAYFCDLTIAADHALFGQNGPRVGSPAAGYIVEHSANILGHKRARELWLLCRKYTAQQALSWGLVNAVVPMAELDATVRQWADEMLSLSPTCLAIIKASFKHQMEHTMELEMNDVVAQVAPGYFQTGEQQEGSSAFLQKRKPNFDPWR